MAKALGGEVVTDMGRAELGMVEVRLTEAGMQDQVFGPLGSTFLVPMGHQDCVMRLPEQAVLLASSAKVENQAFTFPGKPIYCTQFHPELNRASLIERLRAYPKYVRTITGDSVEAFAEKCGESVGSDRLLVAYLRTGSGRLGASVPDPFCGWRSQAKDRSKHYPTVLNG